MFDIGFSELVLIGVLALLVLGPKRLPEVARTAGQWMARLRHFVSNVKRDFDSQLHGEELTELRKLKQELDETRRAFADSSERLVHKLAQTPESPQIEPPSEATPLPLITEPPVPKKPRASRKKAPKSASSKNGRRTKSEPR